MNHRLPIRHEQPPDDAVVVIRAGVLTTTGVGEAAGFAVLATFDAPHYTIALSDLSELTLARLVRCFDEPIPNPGLGLGR